MNILELNLCLKSSIDLISTDYFFGGFSVVYGFFYKNQDVAVVGGGNVAVEETLYLSNIANSVTLILRRDALRAEKMLQMRLFDKTENGNISIIWDHVLEEVIGNETGVTQIRLKNTIHENKKQVLNISGLFIAIGHDPNTDIFKNQLSLDNSNYIIYDKQVIC